MNITEHDKLIYNKYLACSRSAQGKPFKLRKDFSKIEETTLHQLKKLSLFFNKFKHVAIDDFFKAPWSIYSDHIGFDLGFYTTQRALKVYTLYTQRRATAKPDTEEQLYDIKKSLQYILKFCTIHKINIHEYVNHKTNNIYTFMLHLKEHNVNIYTLFGFENFENNMNEIDRDHINFMLGELLQNIPIFRTNYLSSQRAKTFINLGIKKIQDIQKNQLNNKTNNL
jgi:hypothetical protein